MRHPHPPQWAYRFLSWYCNPRLLEEVQGDVCELYARRCREQGKRIADIRYSWDVIRFFRWRNIRRDKVSFTTNPIIMFRSYLTVGLRSAVRHRLNTSINIIGLSLALGIAITSFIFIDSMLNQDSFHANLARIYQVTSLVESDQAIGRIDEWSDIAMPLGPALVKDYPDVEAASRVEFTSGAMKYQEMVFSEPIWFVDQDFMHIFSFPILKGDRSALSHKTNIMVSQEIATKYFGQTDPIGREISIKFSSSYQIEFTIGAVFDRTDQSSLYPEILISMDQFEDMRPADYNNWAYQTDGLFILLKPGHSPKELAAAMGQYIDLQRAVAPQWHVKDFKFQPLQGLGLKSVEIISAVSQGAHPAGLIALGVISLLLLLLASFNYMNVSVATVATRLKEIGIRKVIGGQKGEIVQQFLTENFLLCTLALVLGLLFSYLLFLPGFNSLYPLDIPFAFSSGPAVLLFFGLLLIFVGFVSGAYPAFYISAFTPIAIMRGREKFGQRGLFSRILLTAQFVLAFMTIVAAFVFIDNALYLKSKDWGYEHTQVIAVPVDGKEKFLALRDMMKANPQISQVAGANSHVGYVNRRISLVHQEQRHEVIDYKVGFDYMETMNLRVKEGRLFDRDIQSDQVESVVINVAFAERMGWEKAVGRYFELDSLRRYVIGVVEDFHYDGFYNALGPVVFRVVPEEDFRFLIARATPGHVQEVESALRAAWVNLAPDDPYEGFVQDQVFEDFNRDNNANVKLLGFISTVTVVLASLGLFGLVSFNITRRMKEFSIRRVFGAGLAQVFRLMNRDYVWILAVSFLVGAPVGFYLINFLIQNIYPDPRVARPAPFFVAIAIMALMVTLTVISQLRRVAKENPCVTLKSE